MNLLPKYLKKNPLEYKTQNADYSILKISNKKRWLTTKSEMVWIIFMPEGLLCQMRLLIGRQATVPGLGIWIQFPETTLLT